MGVLVDGGRCRVGGAHPRKDSSDAGQYFSLNFGGPIAPTIVVPSTSVCSTIPSICDDGSGINVVVHRCARHGKNVEKVQVPNRPVTSRQTGLFVSVNMAGAGNFLIRRAADTHCDARILASTLCRCSPWYEAKKLGVRIFVAEGKRGAPWAFISRDMNTRIWKPLAVTADNSHPDWCQPSASQDGRTTRSVSHLGPSLQPPCSWSCTGTCRMLQERHYETVQK